MKSLASFILAVTFLTEVSTHSYVTYYVEDKCKSANEVIIYEINSLRSGTSAVLQGRRTGAPSTDSNCTLIVKPPSGYGIIADFEEIDFARNPHFRRCTDFIKIFSAPNRFPTKLCSLTYKNEEISFWSSAEMRFLYHTEKNTERMENSVGFRLTFTAYTRDVALCNAEDKYLCKNGNCIWSGLTCDGHDNCGDQSDEHDIECETLSDTVIYDVVYIVSGCLVIFTAMTCGIALCCRKKKAQGTIVNVSNLVPRANPYEAIHPSGEFICQDPAGPRTPYPQHHKIQLKAEGGFSNPCYPHGIPQHLHPTSIK